MVDVWLLARSLQMTLFKNQTKIGDIQNRMNKDVQFSKIQIATDLH